MKLNQIMFVFDAPDSKNYKVVFERSDYFDHHDVNIRIELWDGACHDDNLQTMKARLMYGYFYHSLDFNTALLIIEAYVNNLTFEKGHKLFTKLKII